MEWLIGLAVLLIVLLIMLRFARAGFAFVQRLILFVMVLVMGIWILAEVFTTNRRIRNR
jgi:hypothetical protein